MIFNVQNLLSARYAPEAGGQTTPLLSEDAANKAPAPGRVHILADSTADLPDGIAAQVRVIPLSVRFGEEEFLDGIDIDHRRFYEKLVESDVLPTTSQATPGDFAAPFQAVRDAGAEGVVITLASGLSGTYESACLAARASERARSTRMPPPTATVPLSTTKISGKSRAARHALS